MGSDGITFSVKDLIWMALRCFPEFKAHRPMKNSLIFEQDPSRSNNLNDWGSSRVQRVLIP